MSTPTLEDIETAHVKATAAQAAVAQLIVAYKAVRSRVIKLLSIDVELKDGERYAGAILNDDGTINHHVVLLPGEHQGEWEDSKAWAAELGGSLPDRREQRLLMANLAGEFGAFWYWSSEAHSERSAWCQTFGHGYQSLTGKSAQLRARAVRRVFP